MKKPAPLYTGPPDAFESNYIAPHDEVVAAYGGPERYGKLDAKLEKINRDAIRKKKNKKKPT